MSSKTEITKEKLDMYLKELGKEFRKRNGKSIPAEIVIIGGASILVNYGFREMTTDIDAVIHASSAMKDAINQVGDKFDLPKGWLNADFMQTSSYSSNLDYYCNYYRTFSNVLHVRTVSAEYLVAMKLKAGRRYKHDKSDIVCILAEHEKRGQSISLNEIKKAVTNLYEDWQSISEDMREFIEDVYQCASFDELYNQIKEEESQSKEALLEFQQNYPDAVNKKNVDDILKMLKNRN